jgi:hypothetical protein
MLYKSVYSTLYEVPQFENRSVQERINWIEKQIIPATAEEAYMRTRIGLKAIGAFSSLLWEDICAESNYYQEDDYDYWMNLVADIESHFQGQLNMLLVHKTISMRNGEPIVLLYDNRMMLDDDESFIY